MNQAALRKQKDEDFNEKLRTTQLSFRATPDQFVRDKGRETGGIPTHSNF